MKRYSVISAMEMRDFIDRMNMAIRTVGAEPIGGVSTQGALLLQAVIIDIPDVPDTPEDEEEKEKEEKKEESPKAEKKTTTKTKTKKN